MGDKIIFLDTLSIKTCFFWLKPTKKQISNITHIIVHKSLKIRMYIPVVKKTNKNQAPPRKFPTAKHDGQKTRNYGGDGHAAMRRLGSKVGGEDG